MIYLMHIMYVKIYISEQGKDILKNSINKCYIHCLEGFNVLYK